MSISPDALRIPCVDNEFYHFQKDLVILIVDDHPDGCEPLVQFLQMDGFEAICIHSGEAAMESLGVSLPDVMVLDDFMPGMSGLDVMRELRKDSRYEALPIIFYSAGGDASRRATAISLGAVRCIVKGSESLLDIALQIEAFVPPNGPEVALLV